MIKKLFFVLMTSSLILFFSCGSTKQENQNSENLEAPLQTEESLEEAAPEIQEEGLIQNQTEEDSDQQEISDQEESREEENPEASDQEDLDSLYPALEEIEEEEFIDLPYEEVQNKELDEQEIKEAQKAELTEPVTEAEVLPPLPEGAENTEQNSDQEDNGANDPNAATDPNAVLEPAEGETPIEPTIEIQEEPEEEVEILPSRSVSLKKGETLVITYPGNGWIYMGSTSEYNNLASRGRKLGTTDTKYTLLAKEAGTQIHHFYKVDNLTGQYIDDYIEVTVLEKKGNSSTVVNAPAYSEVVPKKPEKPAKASSKKNETPQTSQQEKPAPLVEEKKTEVQASVQKEDTEDSVIEVESEDSVIVIGEEETEENINLEALLDKARSSIKANNNDDAYPLLVQYLEFSTDNRDEALYLQGQILESNSKYRDIKQAVETYQSLCDSFPASPYWDKANKRIIYLKRFYINIH